MFFSGLSLWAVDRGAGDKITDSLRVPPSLWRLDDGGRVQITGTVADLTDGGTLEDAYLHYTTGADR